VGDPIADRVAHLLAQSATLRTACPLTRTYQPQPIRIDISNTPHMTDQFFFHFANPRESLFVPGVMEREGHVDDSDIRLRLVSEDLQSA